MTSPRSDSHYHITNELLLEMMFRADRMINDKASVNLSIGDVWISSSTHSLDVYYYGQNSAAFTYWKPEEGLERVSLDNIRERCNWAPTAFREALRILRKAMVLDDLSEIHD